MPIRHTVLTVDTPGRGALNITGDVVAVVTGFGVRDGIAHLFLQHTSASLFVQENADPAVLRDLEAWLQRTAPDGDARYEHREEGPDDMSAHLRATILPTSLTIPVARGELQLGTWQGVYLYEHRTRPHRRKLVITVFS